VTYDIPLLFPPVAGVASDDESLHVLQETSYPWIRSVRSGSGAEAANNAARQAEGDVLVFLSDCAGMDNSEWLTEMVSHALRPGVGAVGARLWSSQGSLEDGALVLGLGEIATPAFRGIPRGHPGYFNRGWLQQNCSAVSARCLAIRKEVFLQVSGFDDATFPFCFYDVDLCLRLRKLGLQIVWTPYANLTLRPAARQNEEQYLEEATRFKQRWSQELASGDPFYNPNLSLELPGFVLAHPPRICAHRTEQS
jgi:GT2 family glycosyltransferase